LNYETETPAVSPGSFIFREDFIGGGWDSITGSVSITRDPSEEVRPGIASRWIGAVRRDVDNDCFIRHVGDPVRAEVFRDKRTVTDETTSGFAVKICGVIDEWAGLVEDCAAGRR